MAKHIASVGLADRCQAVGGSFFESVPPGADAYLLRRILHDWDDHQCRRILQVVRQAMSAKGKLLVIESVIPPGNDQSFAKMLDLTMLVTVGGKERSEPEYRELLAGSGFRLTRIISTPAEVDIIEAVPA